MDRRVPEIGDFINAPQFFENLGPDRGRLNFAATGFQIVDDFIDELLQGQQTGGTLFESLGNTAGELAPIERFVGAIALDHAQVGALDFLVSGKTISAFETLAAPANAGSV